MSRVLIRLREWLDSRKAADETFSDGIFAEACGVTAGHLSSVISGKRPAGKELAEIIQAETGIDARYILGIAIPAAAEGSVAESLPAKKQVA